MSVDYRPDYDPADVNSDYGHTGGDITVPTFTGDTRPFRFWCQKALPLVYDDSLSYYEVLCKMADYMNNFMTDLTTVEDSMTEFGQQFVINQQFLNSMADQLGQNVADLEAYINARMDDFMAAYTQLQTYVNNYFDNLDVQEEINTKLDEMASDGTLNDLFDPVLETWMQQKTAQIDAAIANQDTIQAAQNARISVLEGRMDTFSGLPSGSTAGNAELLDIRTNFLGETYPTAGDAVRASDMIASGFQAISATQLEDWDGNASSSVYYTVQIDISGYKGGHVVVIGSFENFKADIENTGTCSVYATNTPGKTSDTNAVNYFPGGANSIFTNYTQITTSISGEERLLLQFAIPDDFAYQYLKIGHITDRINPGYFTEPRYIVYANSWSKTQVDPTLSIAGAAADAKATGDAIDELNERLGDVDNVLPKTETMEDITSSIEWTTGKFINVVTGDVDNYADSAYGIVGNVTQGDTFNVTNARGVGSWRAIAIISSDGIINNHCTVLSYYPEETGYFSGEYVVPVNGIMVVGANAQHSTLTVEKQIYQYEDVPAKEDVDSALEEINSVISQFPKIEVETDITDNIEWTTGKFINITSGDVSNYADSAYGIVGNVSQGDTFNVTNARGVGSWRAITIISSEGIVNNHCTVLSYYPEETGYFSGEYVVPVNGIMVVGANADYSSLTLTKITEEYAIEKSPLMDVKWYSIGDSLNEFNSTAETNWIKYMKYATGADNTNLAKSGSGFYRGSPLEGYTQTNYIKQLESVGSDAELITIAGSFNDLMPSPWPALPVGTASDSGTASIAGYMNTFFDTLIANFPNTAIAVVMTSPWDVFKPGVASSDSYVSVLKSICEKHGIPFYSDCYYGCNLRPWNSANKAEYYTHPNSSVDGVHPNSKGHVYIYRMLRPFLEKVVHVST